MINVMKDLTKDYDKRTSSQVATIYIEETLFILIRIIIPRLFSFFFLRLLYFFFFFFLLCVSFVTFQPISSPAIFKYTIHIRDMVLFYMCNHSGCSRKKCSLSFFLLWFELTKSSNWLQYLINIYIWFGLVDIP